MTSSEHIRRTGKSLLGLSCSPSMSTVIFHRPGPTRDFGVLPPAGTVNPTELFFLLVIEQGGGEMGVLANRSAESTDARKIRPLVTVFFFVVSPNTTRPGKIPVDGGER